MATEEQIDELIAYLDAAHPAKIMKKMDDTAKGISAVLRYLYNVGEPVTAGQISSFMNVSTARIAVLLKKMEGKGLIVKQAGAKDARKVMVKLSDAGCRKVEQMREEFRGQVGLLIDRIGYHRMMEFGTIAREISVVMMESCPK